MAFDPSQVNEDVYLAGSVTLQKDTVLIVKAACPPGGTFDMSVEITARSGDGRGGVGVCGKSWAAETYNANENAEIHEGEGWIFVREAGTYDVKASTAEEDSAQVSIELYSDTTPTVVSSEDIAKTGSYSTTLSSIADTVVVDIAPATAATGASPTATSCARRSTTSPPPTIPRRTRTTSAASAGTTRRSVSVRRAPPCRSSSSTATERPSTSR